MIQSQRNIYLKMIHIKKVYYSMPKLKLNSCFQGKTDFQLQNGMSLQLKTKEILKSGLIEFFSARDAQKIIDGLKSEPGKEWRRLDGTLMWVPASRLNYLPLMTTALAMALITAYMVSVKTISIGIFSVSAMHIFFPLGFIFTDLINELFGYQTAKRTIKAIVLILIIVAVGLQIVLSLDCVNITIPSPFTFTTTTTTKRCSDFNYLYTNLPRNLLIHAIDLLIADTFNAYIFAQIRVFLHGKKLWLRSLLSNFFSNISYTIFFDTVNLFGHRSYSASSNLYFHHIFNTLTFKTIYFVTAIPFVYAVVRYIYRRENNMGY